MKLSQLSSCVLLVLSLSTISCNGQKNSKGPQEAILETQMFKTVQEAKLETIRADKKIAMAKVKKGDKAAEQKVKKLASTEKSLIKNVDALSNISLNIPTFKIKPTPPPCPPVIDCSKLFDLNIPLVLGPELKDIQVAIFDTKGNQIGGIEKDLKSSIASKNLKVYSFKLDKKYNGIVDIKVKRILKKGKPMNYVYRTKI